MTKQKQFVITASELKDTIPNQYESLYLCRYHLIQALYWILQKGYLEKKNIFLNLYFTVFFWGLFYLVKLLSSLKKYVKKCFSLYFPGKIP